MWLRRSFLTGALGTASLLHGLPSVRAVSYPDYMLHLINIERRKVGVDPLTLGNNRAAQIHAETMVKFCHAGHWGVDGLKPYMRYSLCGGYHWNAENAGGQSLCVMSLSGNNARLGSVSMALHEAIEDILNSPGHRDNMLDPHFGKVNIGLAWDEYNIKFSQHFETDNVMFHKLPSIEDGRLTLTGATRNGTSLRKDLDFLAALFYDPPPHILTVGQLVRAHAYENPGEIIGIVAAPSASEGLTATVQLEVCNDNPYDVPEDASPPRDIADGKALIEEAKLRSNTCETATTEPSLIFADKWDVGWNSFDVEVNIREVIRQYGRGVYTVGLWHISEQSYFALYSMFYGIEAPIRYS